jgi:alpha-galactosidase
MPWYFLVSGGGVTTGYGVKTGASAICCWQADDGGTTLWLDVSNGGGGVELGPRRLDAGTIVMHTGRYRICFEWRGGKAVNAEIVDYH